MKRFGVLLGLLLLLLTTGCSEPRIDASSRSAFDESSARVLNSAKGETAVALARIFESRTRSGSEAWRELDGMTGDDVLRSTAMQEIDEAKPALAVPPRETPLSTPEDTVRATRNRVKVKLCGEVFLESDSEEPDYAEGVHVLLYEDDQLFREANTLHETVAGLKQELERTGQRLTRVQQAMVHGQNAAGHMQTLDRIEKQETEFFKWKNINYELLNPWTGDKTTLDYHEDKEWAKIAFQRVKESGKGLQRQETAECMALCEELGLKVGELPAENESLEARKRELSARLREPFQGGLPAIFRTEPSKRLLTDSSGGFCVTAMAPGRYVVVAVFPRRWVPDYMKGGSAKRIAELNWWCEAVHLTAGEDVFVVLSQSNVRHQSTELESFSELIPALDQ